MRRPHHYVAATVAAILLLVLTPAAAYSCRITNATLWGEGTVFNPDMSDGRADRFPEARSHDIGMDIWVWFDCGARCGAYYNIQPGKYAQYPGKGGYLQSCTGDGTGTWNRQFGQVYVAHDGEARMKFGTRNVQRWNEYNDEAGAPPDEIYPVSDQSIVLWDVYDGNNYLTGTAIKETYKDTNGTGAACWNGTP